MSTQPTEHEGEVQPKILRGKVDSLSLYEITDYELSLLEAGSPASAQLNFAVFFLSVAASFFAALLAGTITSERVFIVFVVIVVVGFCAGVVLLCLWYRARSKVLDVARKIRDRAPPSEPARIEESETERD